MQVYFIGAGPGDIDLITVKGKKILEKVDVVIYAGSLINTEILNGCKKSSKLFDSAGMTLEEIMDIIIKACENNKTVARLHSGDPSLYGAIAEQIKILEKRNIEYKVIPGVSSFQAAAASLGIEYTVPEVVQSVILTRITGRTKVPEKEKLEDLAKHKASMCIFLSVHKLKDVVNQLLSSYGPDSPVVIIYKASWDDEMVIRGTLSNIVDKSKDIKKTALILVGDFLISSNTESKLYNSEFEHGYRKIK